MYQDDHTDPSLSHESHRTDWTNYEHPSTAVVNAVAKAKGCAQTDLDPLYEYVDGDDLDALLRNAETSLTVSFTYEDAQVEISAAGPLTVRVES